MNGVTLDLQCADGAWTWSLRRGSGVLATGSASCAGDGIAAARVVLDAMLDAGLEYEICRPFRARSWVRGRRT